MNQGLDERYLGRLLGGTVGDALGYPVEFLEVWEIKGHYGPAGLMEPAGPLLYSDDI